MESYLRSIWPPKSAFFNGLLTFVTEKILHCTENCLICDKILEFAMLKPSICEDKLCVFGLEQYGLGLDPAAEISSNPEVVDLLISFTRGAVHGADIRRFQPYPRHVESPNGDKSFVLNKNAEPTNSDMPLVGRVIDLFPSVQQMSQFKTSTLLREHLDKLDVLAYPLLRWILTSARAHLALLKPHERIPDVGTDYQFLLLSSTPAREKKFLEEKKAKGAFWAWHGSGFGNWHAIMRQGLKNMSGTSLMSTGQAYGPGIYLAADSSVSIGYAKPLSGWSKSMFNLNGNELFSVVALCEVITGYKANPYYVIPNEDHVATRYLFLYNSKNICKKQDASSLKIPESDYSKIQRQKI
uniref:Poly [ADP-ribose] polymerase n=1 Tax=Arcella intermedia TaxID=1963864 RepID=A0A6B2L8T5_9EUKA